jgi:hypothetical protein
MKIQRYTQEEFLNLFIFEICANLYEDKYFLEEFSLDGYSDLVFFTYTIDKKIVGFGSHQISSYMCVVDTLFVPEYKYSEHHKELLNHIIDELKDLKQSIFAHQSLETDYEFCLDNGFVLEKKYELPYDIDGLDVMKYCLIFKK